MTEPTDERCAHEGTDGDRGRCDHAAPSTAVGASDDQPDHIPTAEQIRAALRSVSDPDLDGDVIETGAVADLAVTDGVVTVDADFDGLDAAAADALADRIRSAALETPGVERVRVEADVAGPDHGTEIEGVDRLIAVASAKGGVGKTTVATQLARGLAATGESVGIFDADVYGPNVPQLLDVEGPIESTDEGAAKPVDADGIQVVSVGLLANDEPLAWRGAMAHEVVEDLLTDAAWDVDTLVVDLPPGTGDVVLTALQSLPIDGVVLVTTPFPTAAADTDRSATLFREEGVPVLGTVVNMAGFTCPSCGDEHAPFGEDPDVDAPVLAELPIDEDLRAAAGPVPDAVRELAGSVEEAFDGVDSFTVPPNALDLRGVPDRARIEQVRAEFGALSPGESLVAVTDRRPESTEAVRSVLADEADGEPAVATARQGPETWALRVGKADRDCTCGSAAD